LGLDRHRDDPQRHAMNALNERDDENQPRSARRALYLPELEHYRALVLLDDIEKEHGVAFLADVMGLTESYAGVCAQRRLLVIELSSAVGRRARRPLSEPN
jgi:hypothetical protein